MKGVLIFVFMTTFLVIIGGCSDTDYLYTTGNQTVVMGDLNVSGTIIGYSSSSSFGSNDTIIIADECLDVSCNTFVEVAE